MSVWCVIVLSVLIGLARTEPALPTAPILPTQPRICEPIRVELCMNLGYNQTSMPNLGGNDLQQEADYTLQSFAPLIQYGCSLQLKLFLCSVYVPMCTDKVLNPIGPCRNLCENVRSRCYPVLKGFGFPWPDALDCQRFPYENNHEHMCMEGPKMMDIKAPITSVTQIVDDHHCNEDEGCCERATIIQFDEAEKGFAEVWVSVWALTCLISSTFTAITLALGGGRVKARPLVPLAVCYSLTGVGWLVRVLIGRIPINTNCSTVGSDGLTNLNCAFIFLVLYYFGTAADVWWVCLCVWWLAKVAFAWPTERMRTLSSILHVCGWGLPAAQTVAALVRRDVDADDLTGTCYVGNHNTNTLLVLVLMPRLIYFVIGCLVLSIGCYRVIRHSHPTTSTTPLPITASIPLTATTPRKDNDFLGAICTLYAVPSLCVLLTYYYEYLKRDDWLNGHERPTLWIFLLRHLMSLFVGVSATFWTWSIRSLTVWRNMGRRFTPRKQPPLKTMVATPIRYVPTPQPPPPTQSLVVPSSGSISSLGRHSTGRGHRKSTRMTYNLRNGNETII